MKVYTRTGDDGTTALFGGERVPKDDPRVAAYGAVDELNAHLGLARALMVDARLDRPLNELQNALFDVGADLATPAEARAREHIRTVDDGDVTRLEEMIDEFSEGVEPLRQFILPGGHQASAALQVARAVARRAEREVVVLVRDGRASSAVARYLNRLSDLLFVMARLVNADHGVSESRWKVEPQLPPD